MDLRKIKKLIELVEESGVAELEVRSADESIRISMNNAVRQVPSEQRIASPNVASQRNTGAVPAQTHTMKAPMAGVFYQAPTPDAAPFVSIGQQVSAGDVLCIIESMKMMNEIVATVSGVVEEIFVENAEAVSTGSPLFAVS
jgi:acetyl-CoA carboxylase biotin carboxyl carrier protein